MATAIAQADARHHAQIGQIVAAIAGLLGRQASSAWISCSKQASLSVLALVDMGDAEFGRAFGDHVAHARGDDADLDAVGDQPLQAEAVVHVERLELAAVVGVQQPPVGQHAVDVEHRELDARGAFADVGGEVGEVE